MISGDAEIFSKLSKSVFEVLPERVHGSTPTRKPLRLFGKEYATQPDRSTISDDESGTWFVPCIALILSVYRFAGIEVAAAEHI